MRCLLVTLLLLPYWPAHANTLHCSAASGPDTIALLELFTSEGCDSCPPADRWLAQLPQRGYPPSRLIALAFHVDYWNYLGWNDPYARAEFSARQRDAGHRHRSRQIYTPQLLLDGMDYRRSLLRDDAEARITAINKRRPGAQIRLAVEASQQRQFLNATVAISTSESMRTAQAFIAIYENNLASAVTSGENRGRRLRHEFVVRELYGPFAPDTSGRLVIHQELRTETGWKKADLHLALFVQDAASGATLQALHLPWCQPR